MNSPLILTVTQLNSYAKSIVEQDKNLNNVFVAKKDFKGCADVYLAGRNLFFGCDGEHCHRVDNHQNKGQSGKDNKGGVDIPFCGVIVGYRACAV